MNEPNTARDPICGMEVDRQHPPATANRDGQTFYFCSDHCRQKFAEAEPKPGDANAPRLTAKKYFCPMCDGVEADRPGSCPKCGMALERSASFREPSATQYTCPMHPQIVQDQPGNCPICGMALEAKGVPAGSEEESTELREMTRRLWVGAAFGAPVFVLAMSHMFPHAPRWMHGETARWMQFFLSTPVVFWCGWPFFVRGWQSLRHRALNMFTLIAIGVGSAYLFSAGVMVMPQAFPFALAEHGRVGIYFEAAAVITVLVLLGQVLELRARGRTGSAIRALLDLAPKTARVLRGGEENDVPLDEVHVGDRLRLRRG